MPFEMNQKTVMGLILAGLMVLSVVGFSLGSGVSGGLGGTVKHKYGEYTFLQTPQGYRVRLSGADVAFRFLPDQVSQYEFPAGATVALRDATVIMLTFDHQNDTAEFAEAMSFVEFEIEQKLYQRVLVQRGLVNASGFEVAQLSCADASPPGPVVLLQRGNFTGFRWVDNCLIAEADSVDGFLRLGDRISYAALGVIGE